MKPPRSKLRGIRRKGIGDETPRFLMLFPLYGNPWASSGESPDSLGKSRHWAGDISIFLISGM